MTDDKTQYTPNNGHFRTFDSLEKHLSEKIDSVETSLTGKIESVEASLANRIEGVEKFFTAENKAAKDAVSIAMTAAEKAAQKAENAADERTKSITIRLEKIDQTLAASGGHNTGVSSSTALLFQVISSFASIGAIIGLVVVLVRG